MVNISGRWTRTERAVAACEPRPIVVGTRRICNRSIDGTLGSTADWLTDAPETRGGRLLRYPARPVDTPFIYVYELRHSGQLIATGRLTEDAPLFEGQRLHILHGSGTVKEIAAAADGEWRIVIDADDEY